MNTKTMIDNFIIAMLWSSVDDNGEPLDSNYTADDIAPETMVKISDIVNQFVIDCGFLLHLESNLNPTICGYDLWLTLAGHGAGFWDGGWPITGDKLTAWCKKSGYRDLTPYVGDDGLIYL